jgi:hypothetical protein
MSPRINLIGPKIRWRKENLRKRREEFVKDLPAQLATRKFRLTPTPVKERYSVSHTSDGCAVTQYKSYVEIDVVGMPHWNKEFEMTEIILSGAAVEDDD